MARSSYIYIVKRSAVLLAAFTVKHELVSWLKVRDSGRYTVFRTKDGPAPYDVPDMVELNLTELLEEA